MRRGDYVLLFSCFAFAGACDMSKPLTRPVPTPGPQVVVTGTTAISGNENVERGERIRFAIKGTGAGTHFSSETFLTSTAFSDLRVVAVLNSQLLYAQGTVAIAASRGHKDLSVVSGSELAIDPWAFVVADLPAARPLGTPPLEETGAIETAGEAALYQIAPKDFAVRTLVISAERDRNAPVDFIPSLEVYAADGRVVQAPASGCAAIEVRSRAPLFLRVADPLRRAGADRRFHLTASYGDAWLCKKVEP